MKQAAPALFRLHLPWSVRRLVHALALVAAVTGTVGQAAMASGVEAASWKPAGLSGIPVYHLVVDPAAPGVLYATTSGTASRAGLLRSLETGTSWLPLSRGLPAGFEASALAMSSGDIPVLLAAGQHGLFRSVSRGTDWSDTRVPLPALTALHFLLDNPRTVLAGTELRGNFRSLDAGRTWHAANTGLPRDRFGNVPGGVQFAQSPERPDLILMATYGFDGIYRSRDGGWSWTASGEGLPGKLVRAVAINPSAPEHAFAVTDGGLARSLDGGVTWQRVSALPPIEPVALAFEPGTRATVYVAGDRGALFRSTNNGVSWVELAALPRPVRALVTWGTAPEATLAAAAGEGVWHLALRPTLPASPEPPAANRVYYAETGHNLSPTFLPYFRSLGGLDRFGYPRTEELVENGVLVQYFQRGRLEHRPHLRGTPYEVQVSLLGEAVLGQNATPPVAPFESSADQRYFEETGHSVSYAFLRFYVTRGGLDSLGYPISEEMQEHGRPVQYFQRARLEYYVEFAGTPQEVQIGLIGDEYLRQRGWLD